MTARSHDRLCQPDLNVSADTITVPILTVNVDTRTLTKISNGPDGKPVSDVFTIKNEGFREWPIVIHRTLAAIALSGLLGGHTSRCIASQTSDMSSSAIGSLIRHNQNGYLDGIMQYDGESSSSKTLKLIRVHPFKVGDMVGVDEHDPASTDLEEVSMQFAPLYPPDHLLRNEHPLGVVRT